MSIMDKLFGTTPQQPAPANPADLNNPTNPANLTNPTVPATAVLATPSPTEPNPLDVFNKLWENVPISEEDKDKNALFNIDPEKLRAAAASVDFSKSIPPEISARIQAGGADAMTALVEAMNKTAQSTYAQSAMATTKIVEKAVEKAQADFMSKIPAMLKSQNLSNTLLEENPALSHPAAAPLIDAVQKQLTVKYPNATQAELNTMAKNYLAEFANVAVVKPPPEVLKPAKGEYNWSSFLE